MKTIYALLFTLSLFFLSHSAIFATGIICDNNTPPVITVNQPCSVPIDAQIGVPFTIVGNISDFDAGDQVTFSIIQIPTGASVSPTLPITSNNINFIFNWLPTAALGGQMVPVTLVATDLCGSTTNCTILIHVTCAPIVINCLPDTLISPSSTTSQCTAVFNYSVSASSITGLTSSTSVPPSGSTFPAGTTTVMATATDVCGNAATCSFEVTVESPPPTITCPGNIWQAATSGPPCGAIVFFDVSASSYSGFAHFGVSHNTGSFFPGGTTTVTGTVMDYCGSSASCSFDVTIGSSSPPTITCPADITTPATSGSPCGANVLYDLSASGDNGIEVLHATHATGTFFPVGKTTVLATATDYCGNTSSCSFTVTVDPAPPPLIACPQFLQFTISDCSIIPGFSIQATGVANPIVVTYNPPAGTVFFPGTTIVTATATDACGSTASCSFPVLVDAPPPPVIICPANITVPASSGNCTAVVNYTITVTNRKPTDVVVANPPPGSSFPLGNTTVHLSVTDVCGNTSSCSFTVTVTSSLSVNAGPDVSTVFGYASTQTATNTAVASGGNGSYSYTWSLNRALLCNQVNTSGDELFTGGSCTNNICPGTGNVTAAAPACSGSATISATLLADAVACVTVTDANGCRAPDCFNITADDGRCFSGASGKKKTKVCHHTNSPTNPWIQICIDKTAIGAHLAHNRLDYVGPCAATRSALMEEDETFVLYPNPVGSELTLDFGSEGIRSVQLYNTLGALLFETKSEWEQLKLDMSGYPTGIYFISVRDEDNTITVKKFVKM